MSEIVIVSGKGGTGKTSLTGALAALAGKTILVDCDVDAANLHLLIQYTVEQRHDFSTSFRADIDTALCNGCGLCHELCRFNAIGKTFTNGDDMYSVEPLVCEGCGLCVRSCPERAITFESVNSGQWYESVAATGPFLHGRLGVAQSNSGRLVSLLRDRARKTAAEAKYKTILIDGPPGIGCPVIASITGADYLLIVTEPSKSALHDMTRLAGVARHFSIPCAVCINKYDINPELTRQIELFSAEQSIPVLGEISFDEGFVRAQVDGTPLFQFAKPENIAVITNLWDVLSKTVPDERAYPESGFKV